MSTRQLRRLSLLALTGAFFLTTSTPGELLRELVGAPRDVNVLVGSCTDRIWREVEPWFPHSKPYPLVEGWYTKFSFPTLQGHSEGEKEEGMDTITVIFTHINNTKAGVLEHMLHFSYTPAFYDAATKGQNSALHVERSAESYSLIEDRSELRFEFVIEGLGHFVFKPDMQTYEIDLPDQGIFFRASITSRVPWSRSLKTFANGPEGWINYLGSLLPLHWYVYSLGSKADLSFSHPHFASPQIINGADAHMEKNWGDSFPSGWMWSQAQNEYAALVLAGGRILGLDAFLIGYRSEKLQWDFRPPTSLRFKQLPSMTFHEQHDWKRRVLKIRVISIDGRRLDVEVTSPKHSFVVLACPMNYGFHHNFAQESFSATTRVRASQLSLAWRSWVPVPHWKLIEEQIIPNAALEFGGNYCEDMTASGDKHLDNTHDQAPIQLVDNNIS